MSMGGSRRVSGIVCFCTQGWDICRKKALDGRDVAGQSQQHVVQMNDLSVEIWENEEKHWSSFCISLLLVLFFRKMAITGFSFP